MAPTSDGDLWRAAQAGDAESFGVLFDRHADAIYTYCFRRTADWTVAEDLTSVVFLETWRRIAVWRGRRGYWSKVYDGEVAREGKTSKAGSVIARILLVPFVLLFIFMIVWMVVTLP